MGHPSSDIRSSTMTAMAYMIKILLCAAIISPGRAIDSREIPRQPSDNSIEWESQALLDDFGRFCRNGTLVKPGEFAPGVNISTVTRSFVTAWNSDSLTEVAGMVCRRYGPLLNLVSGGVVRPICVTILRAIDERQEADFEGSCYLLWQVISDGSAMSPLTSCPAWSSSEDDYQGYYWDDNDHDVHHDDDEGDRREDDKSIGDHPPSDGNHRKTSDSFHYYLGRIRSAIEESFSSMNGWHDVDFCSTAEAIIFDHAYSARFVIDNVLSVLIRQQVHDLYWRCGDSTSSKTIDFLFEDHDLPAEFFKYVTHTEIDGELCAVLSKYASSSNWPENVINMTTRVIYDAMYNSTECRELELVLNIAGYPIPESPCWEIDGGSWIDIPQPILGFADYYYDSYLEGPVYEGDVLPNLSIPAAFQLARSLLNTNTTVEGFEMLCDVFTRVIRDPAMMGMCDAIRSFDSERFLGDCNSARLWPHWMYPVAYPHIVGGDFMNAFFHQLYRLQENVDLHDDDVPSSLDVNDFIHQLDYTFEWTDTTCDAAGNLLYSHQQTSGDIIARIMEMQLRSLYRLAPHLCRVPLHSSRRTPEPDIFGEETGTDPWSKIEIGFLHGRIFEDILAFASGFPSTADYCNHTIQSFELDELQYWIRENETVMQMKTEIRGTIVDTDRCMRLVAVLVDNLPPEAFYHSTGYNSTRSLCADVLTAFDVEAHGTHNDFVWPKVYSEYSEIHTEPEWRVPREAGLISIGVHLSSFIRFAGPLYNTSIYDGTLMMCSSFRDHLGRFEDEICQLLEESPPQEDFVRLCTDYPYFYDIDYGHNSSFHYDLWKIRNAIEESFSSMYGSHDTDFCSAAQAIIFNHARSSRFVIDNALSVLIRQQIDHVYQQCGDMTPLGTSDDLFGKHYFPATFFKYVTHTDLDGELCAVLRIYASSSNWPQNVINMTMRVIYDAMYNNTECEELEFEMEMAGYQIPKSPCWIVDEGSWVDIPQLILGFADYDYDSYLERPVYEGDVLPNLSIPAAFQLARSLLNTNTAVEGFEMLCDVFTRVIRDPAMMGMCDAIRSFDSEWFLGDCNSARLWPHWMYPVEYPHIVGGEFMNSFFHQLYRLQENVDLHDDDVPSSLDVNDFIHQLGYTSEGTDTTCDAAGNLLYSHQQTSGDIIAMIIEMQLHSLYRLAPHLCRVPRPTSRGMPKPDIFGEETGTDPWSKIEIGFLHGRIFEDILAFASGFPRAADYCNHTIQRFELDELQYRIRENETVMQMKTEILGSIVDTDKCMRLAAVLMENLQPEAFYHYTGYDSSLSLCADVSTDFDVDALDTHNDFVWPKVYSEYSEIHAEPELMTPTQPGWIAIGVHLSSFIRFAGPLYSSSIYDGTLMMCNSFRDHLGDYEHEVCDFLRGQPSHEDFSRFCSDSTDYDNDHIDFIGADHDSYNNSADLQGIFVDWLALDELPDVLPDIWHTPMESQPMCTVAWDLFSKIPTRDTFRKGFRTITRLLIRASLEKDCGSDPDVPGDFGGLDDKNGGNEPGDDHSNEYGYREYDQNDVLSGDILGFFYSYLGGFDDEYAMCIHIQSNQESLDMLVQIEETMTDNLFQSLENQGACSSFLDRINQFSLEHGAGTTFSDMIGFSSDDELCQTFTGYMSGSVEFSFDAAASIMDIDRIISSDLDNETMELADALMKVAATAYRAPYIRDIGDTFCPVVHLVRHIDPDMDLRELCDVLESFDQVTFDERCMESLECYIPYFWVAVNHIQGEEEGNKGDSGEGYTDDHHDYGRDGDDDIFRYLYFDTFSRIFNHVVGIPFIDSPVLCSGVDRWLQSSTSAEILESGIRIFEMVVASQTWHTCPNYYHSGSPRPTSNLDPDIEVTGLTDMLHVINQFLGNFSDYENMCWEMQRAYAAWNYDWDASQIDPVVERMASRFMEVIRDMSSCVDLANSVNRGSNIGPIAAWVGFDSNEQLCGDVSYYFSELRDNDVDYDILVSMIHQENNSDSECIFRDMRRTIEELLKLTSQLYHGDAVPAVNRICEVIDILGVNETLPVEVTNFCDKVGENDSIYSACRDIFHDFTDEHVTMYDGSLMDDNANAWEYIEGVATTIVHVVSGMYSDLGFSFRRLVQLGEHIQSVFKVGSLDFKEPFFACSFLRLVLTTDHSKLVHQAQSALAYPLSDIIEFSAALGLCQLQEIESGTSSDIVAYRLMRNTFTQLSGMTEDQFCTFLSGRPSRDEFRSKGMLMAGNVFRILTNEDFCREMLYIVATEDRYNLLYNITGKNLSTLPGEREEFCHRVVSAFTGVSTFIPEKYTLNSKEHLEDWEPFMIPGEFVPDLSVLELIDMAGSAYSAASLMDGATVFCDVFGDILSDEVDSTDFNVSGICNAIRLGHASNLEKQCLNLTVPPYYGNAYPLSLRAVRFDHVVGSLLLEFMGTAEPSTQYDVCPAVDNLFNSGLTVPQVAHTVLRILLSELLPAAADICDGWDEIMWYISPMGKAQREGRFINDLSDTYGGIDSRMGDHTNGTSSWMSQLAEEQTWFDDTVTKLTGVVSTILGYSSRVGTCQFIRTTIHDRTGRVRREAMKDMIERLLSALYDYDICASIISVLLDALEVDIEVISGYPTLEDFCTMTSDALRGIECDGSVDCSGNCNGVAVEDCARVCGGVAQIDKCGECSGGESGVVFDETRIDCSGECDGQASLDSAGRCIPVDTVCTEEFDCNGRCGGLAVVDCNGVCDGGAAEDCSGTCGGKLTRDCSNACGGTLELDCAGVCGGDAVVDCAGICNGNTPVDCSGSCMGEAVEDCRGVCQGQAVTNRCGHCVDSIDPFDRDLGTDKCGNCLGTDKYKDVSDCFGTCYGEAYIDRPCGECVGGETGRVSTAARRVDCRGVCDGGWSYDACGLCGEGHNISSSKYWDCNGECHPPGTSRTLMAYTNRCGYCVGGSTGRPLDQGVDACGECDGGDASCTGCDGVLKSGSVEDACGVCGGTGSSCVTIATINRHILRVGEESEISVSGAGFDVERPYSCSLAGVVTVSGVMVPSSLTSGVCTITADTAGSYTFSVLLDGETLSIKDETSLMVYVVPVVTLTGYSPALPIASTEGTDFTLTAASTDAFEVFKEAGATPHVNIYLSDETSGVYSRAAARFDEKSSSMLHVSVPATRSDQYYVKPFIRGIGEISDSHFPVTIYAPSPELTDLYFNDRGSAVIAMFDSPVARLESCEDILWDLAPLGDGPSCIWLSARKLKIIIGRGKNLVDVGDTLLFKRSQIKALFQDFPYPEDDDLGMEMSIAPPISPPPVRAELFGSSLISSCGKIKAKLYSEGAAGRRFNYEWSVEGPPAPELESTLEAFSGRSLELDASLISPDVTYMLLVNVTNFLGGSAVASLDIKKSTFQTPDVIVNAIGIDPQNVFVSDSFGLVANIFFSVCVPPGETVFRWSVDNPAVVLSEKRDSRKLFVDANTLPGDADITFTIRIYKSNSPESSVEASITVRTLYSKLRPAIAQGRFVTVGLNTGLFQLDGSLSYDPDNVALPEEFQWQCEQYDSVSMFTEDAGASVCWSYKAGHQRQTILDNANPSAATLQFDAAHMNADKIYNFTLIYRKALRSEQVFIVVKPVAWDPPRIEINPIPGRVQAGDDLTITASIRHSSPLATAVWSTTGTVDDGYMDMKDTDNFITPPSLVLVARRKSFMFMAFKKNVLTPGTTYQFHLVVTTEDNRTSEATVEVRVRSVVTSCVVTLDSGATNYTQLENIDIAVDSCTTDRDAYPLTYQLFIQNADSEFTSITTAESSDRISVAGPPAEFDQGSVPWNLFRVKVCDKFQSCQDFDLRLTVASAVLSEEDVAEAFRSLVQEPEQKQDYGKALGGVNALSSVVGETPGTATRRRRAVDTVECQITSSANLDRLRLGRKQLESSDMSLEDSAHLITDLIKYDLSTSCPEDTAKLLGLLEMTVGWFVSGKESVPPTTARRLQNFLLNIEDSQLPRKLTRLLRKTLRHGLKLGGEARKTVTSQFKEVLKKALPKGRVVLDEDFEMDVGQDFETRFGVSWNCSTGRCDGVIFGVTQYNDTVDELSQTGEEADAKVSANLDITAYEPDSGDELNITGLSDPIMFNLTFSRPLGDQRPECRYWDSSTASWSSEGLATEQVDDAIVTCNTRHLSTFTVIGVAPPTTTNKGATVEDVITGASEEREAEDEGGLTPQSTTEKNGRVTGLPQRGNDVVVIAIVVAMVILLLAAAAVAAAVVFMKMKRSGGGNKIAHDDEHEAGPPPPESQAMEMTTPGAPPPDTDPEVPTAALPPAPAIEEPQPPAPTVTDGAETQDPHVPTGETEGAPTPPTGETRDEATLSPESVPPTLPAEGPQPSSRSLTPVGD